MTLELSPELPDYPHGWTSEQRVGAYWYALRIDAQPQTTADWPSILAQAERVTRRHRDVSMAADRSDAPSPDNCRRCRRICDRHALDRRGICPACRLNEAAEFPAPELPLNFNGNGHDPEVPW